MLSAEEISELKATFDADKNKKLSLEEFQSLAKEISRRLEVPIPSELAVQEIFTEFDNNHSGSISFLEFDAASLQLQKRLQKGHDGSMKVETSESLHFVTPSRCHSRVVSVLWELLLILPCSLACGSAMCI